MSRFSLERRTTNPILASWTTPASQPGQVSRQRPLADPHPRLHGGGGHVLTPVPEAPPELGPLPWTTVADTTTERSGRPLRLPRTALEQPETQVFVRGEAPDT